MRAIDAIGLKQSISVSAILEDGKTLEQIIDEQPTIDPERTGRWIPCSERLPEYSGRYLVSVLDGIDRRTTVAPYHPQSRTWTLTGRMAYWKVIAWMPLPEPYREGK